MRLRAAFASKRIAASEGRVNERALFNSLGTKFAERSADVISLKEDVEKARIRTEETKYAVKIILYKITNKCLQF